MHPLTGNLSYHIYNLGRLYRHFFSEITQTIHSRIFPEQWIILSHLDQTPAIAQTALMSPFAVGMGGLTRSLLTMERRGWISRKKDPSDRRRTNVVLTSHGAKIHRRIASIGGPVRTRLFDGISDRDHNTALKVLAQLEKNLLRELAATERRPGAP